MPIEITQPSQDTASPARTRRKSAKARASGLKISDDQRMFFIEQLSLLLETGTSLHQALQSLAHQTKDATMQPLLAQLADDVAAGKPFSVAMSRHPRVFSGTYVCLIAASENGGFMHEGLNELLAMEEKRQELKSTIFAALSYPVFLVFFSLAVVIFVLAVVFPKFAPMFANIHDQLPATTIVLMAASDAIRVYWMQILLALAAVVAGVLAWLRSPAGKLTVDRLKLSIPGVRTISIEIYMVQMLRVMSLSLANGVRIVETLQATRDVVSNSIIRALILRVEDSVQQGAGVASGFAKSDVLPAMVRQMITTGEESGDLAKVTGRLASYYEKELNKKLTALSKMAEPVMLLVMGLIVGVLVSSLILPIFKLSRAVS